MAIFFPPPPPVFTGGAQPYAQRQGLRQEAAQAVNNPPFGGPEALIVLGEAVAAAQPPAWQYAYLGAAAGLQPYGPRQLNPSLTAVPVSNPPFADGGPFVEIIEAAAVAQPDPWTYRYFGAAGPFLPKQNSPAIPGQSNDPPPFTHRGLIPATAEEIALAQPNPWTYNFDGATQPFTPRKLPLALTAVPVNDPPFDRRAAQTNAALVAIAQPNPWVYAFQGGGQPYGQKPLPPFRADAPPFTHFGRTAQYASEVAQQQPDPWTYTFLGGRAPFDPRKITVSVTYLPPTVKIYVIN